MDALRGIAMLLGVVLHTALVYMHNSYDKWGVVDPQSSMLFDVLFWTIHLFRMETFFFVAGFFACMLLIRYGIAGFARHRTLRIALPYVVGIATLVPIGNAVWVMGMRRRGIGDPAESDAEAVLNRLSSMGIHDYLTPWHLWFLLFLLVLYAIAIAWAAASSRLGIARAASRWCTDLWAQCVRWHLAAPVFIALTFPILFLHNGPGADTNMMPWPEPRIVLYFSVFFFAGWMTFRRDGLLELLARLWYVWISVGLSCTFIALSMVEHRDGAGAEFQSVYNLVSASATATLVVGFTGMFVHLLRRPSRVMRYISDSSYWVYLVHLPLVVFIAMFLVPLPIGPYAKFTLVIVSSCAIMYLSYQLLVRYSLVGVMLNGPKLRQARRARAGTAPRPSE